MKHGQGIKRKYNYVFAKKSSRHKICSTDVDAESSLHERTVGEAALFQMTTIHWAMEDIFEIVKI